MLSHPLELDVQFAGSDEDRDLAAKLLGLMRARGRFMSANAPIRLSLETIAEYFEGTGVTGAETRLRAAVAANAPVFAIEEIDGQSVVVTTRRGIRAVEVDGQGRHDFAQRLMTPQPKPERPPVPVRERPRIDERWSTLQVTLDYLEEEAAPADTVVETEVVEATLEVEMAAVDEQAVEPVAAEAPVVPPARTITIPVVTPTDVTGIDDLELAAAIRQRLAADPRVANFGEQWLMEDRVPRFSRGDLRRLREYLQEQEQPLADDVLAQDVLGVRAGSAEFELTRFAIDYRLSREKEFEFVGTTNQRFWSTNGLPPIGTTRRKPNELGTDYRFLLDEMTEGPAYRSVESVDHVLTFFEYIHGLLPYDSQMQRLLPAPLQPNQRGAVLTFETPQSYTTYLVELRYPTPNRGGFILGLDDFYTENLVPGAIISISRTENDGHYRVEYLAESGQNGRLLELDERRAQRYVFRPTTFACGVEPRMLLTEDRMSGLNGEKPLDEKVRRRPESVVAATFERIGQHRGGNYSADFDTLLAGVNVERPMTETLLRSTLENDDTGAFSRDPEGQDVYTYVPGTTP